MRRVHTEYNYLKKMAKTEESDWSGKVNSISTSWSNKLLRTLNLTLITRQNKIISLQPTVVY